MSYSLKILAILLATTAVACSNELPRMHHGVVFSRTVEVVDVARAQQRLRTASMECYTKHGDMKYTSNEGIIVATCYGYLLDATK